MANLNLSYVELIQNKREVEERNARALAYSARCNKKRNKKASAIKREVVYDLISGVLCFVASTTFYLLIFFGVF